MLEESDANNISPPSTSSSFSSAPQDDPVVLDLGPEEDARRKGLYRRPPGPVQGGILKVPHPGTAQGLLRINKDGSYQYKTDIRAKSQAVSIRAGVITPPPNRPAPTKSR